MSFDEPPRMDPTQYDFSPEAEVGRSLLGNVMHDLHREWTQRFKGDERMIQIAKMTTVVAFAGHMLGNYALASNPGNPHSAATTFAYGAADQMLGVALDTITEALDKTKVAQ